MKPASGEERITSAEPAKVVEELSRQKAMFTAYALEEEENRDLRDVVVIGADTVVSYEGKILGKPADETAAIEMLAMLQEYTSGIYRCNFVDKRKGDGKLIPSMSAQM